MRRQQLRTKVREDWKERPIPEDGLFMLDSARARLRVLETTPEPEPPTPKLYRAIMADPAWKFGNRSNRASPDNNLGAGGARGAAAYKTMTLDDICAMPVAEIAEPDCLLAMWAPWTMVLDARIDKRASKKHGFTIYKPSPANRVLLDWGFVPKQGLTWIKGRFDDDGNLVLRQGMGNYVRVCTEVLIIATRGRVQIPTANRAPGLLPLDRLPLDEAGFLAPRGRHSKKPEIARHFVESLVTEGPYAELFARDKVDGWDLWGNEAPDADPYLAEKLSP